jgi:hypothetical protein
MGAVEVREASLDFSSRARCGAAHLQSAIQEVKVGKDGGLKLVSGKSKRYYLKN